MAERPPALSAEALAALTAYRDATPMPEAARERVHARLSATGPARTTRPAWLWVGVGAIAAGLLLWGALGVGDALRASTDPAPNGSQAPMQAPQDSGDTAAVVPDRASEPTTRRPSLPRPSAALVPAEDLETPQESVAPEPTDTPPAPARRKAKPATQTRPEPAPATPPASRLGAENRLIARTWNQVRAKQYSKARQTLAEHESEFPAGVLAPERSALLVIVECLQHPESAARRADAYAATGRNTLLAKVRSACDEKKTSPK